MSEQNKAVIREALEEVANKGNYDAAGRLLDPDYVGHSTVPEMETRGIEGYKQFYRMLRAAFPDLHIDIEEQIAEGDKVVTRFTAHGTHDGDFMGIAPTGRQGSMTGILIDRVSGGKLAECWANTDDLGLLRTIGALPEPARSA